MSIASAIANAQAKVAAAYSACNEKGATMPAVANRNLSNLASTIGSISGGGGGGGGATTNSVMFRDYDGMVVASYSASEFAGLSAMPDNPSHEGLTAQGWNWSLAGAKTYVATYGALEIGQMYITNDGKTRLYIKIVDSGRMTVPLYWNQSIDNGVVIDWGDGSNTQTFSGTGNLNTTHTYGAVGDYVISLTASSGALSLGNSKSSLCVLGSTANSATSLPVYRNMLQKVEIGSGVTSIAAYAFYYCYSLASVTIPSTVTSIGTYAFRYCYSLASVTLLATTPPTLGNVNAFSNTPSNMVIYVPAGSVDTYKTASNWSNFANRIQAIP